MDKEVFLRIFSDPSSLVSLILYSDYTTLKDFIFICVYVCDCVPHMCMGVFGG